MQNISVSIATLAAITAAAFLIGCGKAQPPAAKPAPQAAQQAPAPRDEPKHAAHGAGPHEGAVADWGGGKFHVEFTVDHDKQEATVYVLGDDEKTAAPVKADKLLLSIKEPSFQVELAPVPLDGEPAGTSSRFVGKNEKLGKVQEFAGTISSEVDGTPYVGEFKEEPPAAAEKK